MDTKCLNRLRSNARHICLSMMQLRLAVSIFLSIGNYELMFIASTDAGQTFGNKINLSNTSNSESVDASIAAASGSNIYVSR